MIVNILNESKQGIGGGWTFRENLIDGFKKIGVQVSEKWEGADIVLIPSSSMVTKETFHLVSDSGKKIVLRIDNIPRNSRNRNTGTTRLQGYVEKAHGVIYQSEWAKTFVGDWLKKEGEIIYNGINLDIFKPDGALINFSKIGSPVYLYSRFNRDETKHFDVAHYEFQMISRKNPEAVLILVGQFSPELRETNFDFFNGEKIKYLGVLPSGEDMARVYRGCDYIFATYFNDCYSNTYCEALCCGLEMVEEDLSGGTMELIANWKLKGRKFFSHLRMASQYRDYLKGVLDAK